MGIDMLCAQVRCKTRSVSRALDLIGALATREYAHTAYYSGPFTIGDMMTMRVKVGLALSASKFWLGSSSLKHCTAAEEAKAESGKN